MTTRRLRVLVQTRGDLQEALLEAVTHRLQAHHADAGTYKRRIHLGRRLGSTAQHDADAVLGGLGIVHEVAGTERAQRQPDVVDSDDQLTASAGATAGDLGDRTLGDDLAAVDDRSGVTDLFDLVEQVRGQKDGAFLPLDHRADHLAELLDAPGIKPVGRLVEDQQLRIGQQAAGDTEALAHAERVLLDFVLRPLGEADTRER